MLHKLDTLGAKARKTYASLTATLDLKLRGGVGAGARRIEIGTAGDLYVRIQQDGSEDVQSMVSGEIQDLDGVWQIATGDKAVTTSGAGSYPAVDCDGKTMVVRLDEGTDLDSGADVTITFIGTSLTQAQFIAQINAALNAAMPEPGGHPDYAFAADAGGDTTTLSSRARGSDAAVEIVSIDAEVATATGFGAGTDNGTDFGSPAGNITVFW